LLPPDTATAAGWLAKAAVALEEVAVDRVRQSERCALEFHHGHVLELRLLGPEHREEDHVRQEREADDQSGELGRGRPRHSGEARKEFGHLRFPGWHEGGAPSRRISAIIGMADLTFGCAA